MIVNDNKKNEKFVSYAIHITNKTGYEATITKIVCQRNCNRILNFEEMIHFEKDQAVVTVQPNNDFFLVEILCYFVCNEKDVFAHVDILCGVEDDLPFLEIKVTNKTQATDNLFKIEHHLWIEDPQHPNEYFGYIHILPK